jgi:hypothetical protein
MPDRDVPVALSDGYSITSLGIIVVSANEVPTGRTMYRRLRRQGRGMAELREPQMLNANKAVKMALKRAQVDAVLRCAGLSQWFTQDLEEPPYIAPGAATDNAPAGSPETPETAETPQPPPAGRYRQYLRERRHGVVLARGAARLYNAASLPLPLYC